MSALLDDVRTVLRRRHMSYATQKSYPGSIRRSCLFHRDADGRLATIEIHTHLLNRGARGVVSPLDGLG